MRRCDDRRSLARALEESSREAEAAFGDGRLYLEKLILGARHVEFQVLCDAFGHGVHLGERECSVQRNHQKLIEESPSPAVDGPTRDRLGRRVAAAVTAVGYRSAGTVEFLLGADGAFHFMEMNTRLQVEHPVTEMLTGIDIVVEQIRIAANERLRLTQDDVAFSGHAIELRINAEDPAAGFRPDPGRIERFVAPSVDGVRIRWDSAVRSGTTIPPHYDSLIGKLVVHGADRAAAIDAAARALASMTIEGVRTTVPLHAELLSDERFRSGRYDLDLLASLRSARGAA
jgi:acetyl-CoA carboxylase biotin carboxylase subunit